ncbi:MAG: hypothetical protein IJ232_00105 [Lachnospiraceae bacterium]|nr:hypothetical protein [Lachnospiraceae bacterium]
MNKNTVQNASHQSENIIIDLRRTKISQEQALKEIERYFRLSKRLRRIIIITKDEIILDNHK